MLVKDSLSHDVIEECLDRVPDAFTLVVLAAYRAQELATGSKSCVSREQNKECILSLREIGSGCVDVADLRGRVVKSFQHFSFLSD